MKYKIALEHSEEGYSVSVPADLYFCLLTFKMPSLVKVAGIKSADSIRASTPNSVLK